MNHTDPNTGWGAMTRLLHWLMAALILAQFAGGWIADQLERSPAKADLMTAHKSLGISILMLLLLRAAWRWTHAAPPPLPGALAWEKTLARWSHFLLYVLMAAVPLSGWLAASTSRIPWNFFWLFPWPRIAQPDQDLHHRAEDLHALLIWILAVVLATHILAALRHHFVKKNDVLRRMLKGR